MNTYKFLQGGGEMGKLIRNTDWSQTTIGAPDVWPDSLQSAVSISLNSGFPIAIYWGKNFTLIYNDAWSSIPGEKHPWALGKPGEVVWPEIWDGLRDQFNRVLNGADSIHQPDALLLMNRHGYVEECYFDYTLSPIIAPDGTIGGVFNAVIETTYKVLNERRNKILLNFLQKLNSTRSVKEGIAKLKTIIDNAREDIPFCLLYAYTEEGTEIAVLSPDVRLKEQMLSVNWPATATIHNHQSFHVKNVSEYINEPIISIHGEVCKETIIVPLNRDDAKITGYMVLGVSPRKMLDQDYQQFLETIALHTGTILNNAYRLDLENILHHEQALNEQLAAANEELSATNEELNQTQENLQNLNNELEDRVQKRTEALSESEARFRNMIQQAPVAMTVFKGDDMVISLANPPSLKLAVKTEEIIGLPLLQAIPEMKNQPILDVLYNVYKTGEAFTGVEVPIMLERNGIMDTAYFNISYTPFFEDGIITGVLQASFEVTEQVLIRTKIQEREMNLSSLVEASPYALMLLKGREWKIELVNQEIANLWDKKLEDIKGKTLMEVLPEIEDQPFPAFLKQVYNTSIPYEQEEQVLFINTPAGKVKKYVSFKYSPLLSIDGTVTGIIVAASDITTLVESKNLLEASYEAQQALNEEIIATSEEMAVSNEALLATNEKLFNTQESLHQTIKQVKDNEAKLRFMLADAPVAIGILTGRDLIIESANDKILEVWGKSDVIIGTRLDEALPELQGQPFLQILDDVYTSGEPFFGNEALALLERKGKLEEAFFNYVYHPMKDIDNNTFSIMVVATEVTEQVMARQKIEDSEKRFRFILNAIPQQVWTATPDGALDYVNEVVCRDFGYTMDEVIGHGWQKFIHPDDLQGCLDAWSTSLKTGERYTYEFRLLMRTGEYVWHLVNAVPYIESGAIKLWLGTNTDIELQKRNEQKKDEFLSIASHELKTPLTSIKAFNQLIQRTKDVSKLSGFAAKSAEHIFRLEKLINDLLDVTKINAGKMTYTIEPFAFTTLLANSIESVQHMYPSHQIILESAVNVNFKGDQLRLEQVMQNFLTNAVKYSPDADKVIVKSRVERDNIIVAVQDFGIGIAQDHLDRLFERYYRVDNTAMRFEGLGLGLFISSEILKRHKGSFWIESELGKGSTFYFRMPLHPDAELKPVMKSDTFYQDKSIIISYNQTHERLDVDWIGFHDLESVKACGMIMFEIFAKNNCSKIINDNRNVLGTWSDAAEWVGQEWFPMMEKAGLKYFAWVFSSSSFSKMSAIKSVDVMVGNVTTQLFTDINLAEQWLAETALTNTTNITTE